MTYPKALEMASKEGYIQHKEVENAYDDHEFWRTFSKAMRWSNFLPGTDTPTWYTKYISFKDHTLAGNSPESWFKWVDLTQN
jgi:anthranilate/para-aminobenzoate synthase component I